MTDCRYHVTVGLGIPVTLHTSNTVSFSFTIMSSLDSSSMIVAGTVNRMEQIDLFTVHHNNNNKLLRSDSKKGKGNTGMFLYSAVSSPLHPSKRFTLFLPRQTCSFRHQLGFSGKHSSHVATTRNDYSLTFPQYILWRQVQCQSCFVVIHCVFSNFST